MTSSLHVPIDAVDGLTVADVMHATFATLPADATIAEARAWLAAGTSRRLALLTDAGGRFMGALTPADVGGHLAPDEPAVHLSKRPPTLAPGESAAAGRDAVLATSARRTAVVDDDGRLVGVLALTTDGRRFACA